VPRKVTRVAPIIGDNSFCPTAEAAGVDPQLESIDGADHGFKGADADRAQRSMFAFFDRYLKMN